MSTSPDSLPPLDYGHDARTWSALALVAFGTALLFLGATMLTFLPSLHNDNPFFPLWVIAGAVATVALLPALPLARRRVAGAALVRSSLIVWLVCAPLGTLAAWGRYAREDPHVTTRRMGQCVSHLRNLGQALTLYAGDHGGKYPDSLVGLAQMQDLNPESFLCAAVVPNPGSSPPSRDRVIADLESGRNAQHVYLGKGLTLTCSAGTVLAHDHPDNWAVHGGGMSVLFADGAARFLNPRQAKKLLAELAAGHNPPRVAKFRREDD